MITEPVPFLANIAIVSHADGQLTPSELGQLEQIRSELGFKKGDLSRALSLVEKKSHQITFVGTFADQVKNLELMLRVAYCDNDVSDAEAAIIGEFCERIGLSQEQLNRMAEEVINHQLSRSKVCAACGTESPEDAKFCPTCGQTLVASENVIKTDFKIPATGIAIEFADSTAASFPKALEIAKSADSYSNCQRSGKTWHLAVFTSETLTPALPLVGALSSLRNKRVYLNGAETIWDELFGFAWCACQRRTAYRPVEYCFGKDVNRFNPWGCKQAQMDWCEWSAWFSYGAWEQPSLLSRDYIWRFDKNRIKHELATNLFRSRFCPHLVVGLAEAVLRHLPETVNPAKDPNWSYSRQYEQLPGTIKVVEQEGAGVYSFTNEYWSDGVRPKGHGALQNILKKAFADCGVAQDSAALLL